MLPRNSSWSSDKRFYLGDTSPMVNSVQAFVLDRLKRKHLSPPLDWCVACLDFLQSQHEYQSIPQQQLAQLVEEQLLLANFRDLGLHCLPSGLDKQKCTQLNGNYVLQVEEMRDIGRPAYGQLQKLRKQENSNAGVSCEEKIYAAWEPKEGRILLLTMTDGTQSVKGMEYRPIPALSVCLPPGFKLQIKGPVECRKGMLLLQSHHLHILGGDVETMKVRNAAENVLARTLGWPENPSPCDSPKLLHSKVEVAVEQEVKPELPQRESSPWRSNSAATNDFGTQPKSTHMGHLAASLQATDQTSQAQPAPSTSIGTQGAGEAWDFMDSDDDVYFAAVDAAELGLPTNGPNTLTVGSSFMEQSVNGRVGIDKREQCDVKGSPATFTSAGIPLANADPPPNLPAGKGSVSTRQSSIQAYLTKSRRATVSQDTKLLFNSSHPHPQLSGAAIADASFAPMQNTRPTQHQSRGLTNPHSSLRATAQHPMPPPRPEPPGVDLDDLDCSLLLDEDPFEEELQSVPKKPRTGSYDLQPKEASSARCHWSTGDRSIGSASGASEQQILKHGSHLSSNLESVMDTKQELVTNVALRHSTACEPIAPQPRVGSPSNRDIVAISPMIVDTRGSLSLFSTRLPFQYLKALLREPPFVGMQACVKAIVTTLLSPLTIKDGQWQLLAKINDGSASLDVAFAHQIVEELVGLKPSDAKQLARSSDVVNRKKVVEATTKASRRIMHLSCLLHLEWTLAAATGSLLPVIKRMDDLTETRCKTSTSERASK